MDSKSSSYMVPDVNTKIGGYGKAYIFPAGTTIQPAMGSIIGSHLAYTSSINQNIQHNFTSLVNILKPRTLSFNHYL